MLVKALGLAPGATPFRGYTLQQVLGEGAYGVVWEALKDTGERVALKFLPFAASRANRQEIKAIQLISRLVHPGLTPTHDVWSYQQCFVIAMALAEGSLSDLLKVYQMEYQTPIDPKELVRLLKQAAQVLDFLNARRHVVDGRTVALQHCDVKPSNLLLFGETVKLADFGLVSIASQPINAHRPVGTPAYMAPELIMGRLSDRCDQFSLAVTYIMLRTGQLPWPPEEPSATLDRVVWPLPDLSGLSPPERPILARALATVPQDRWPSCSDMMDQLAEATTPRRSVQVLKETRQGVSNRPTFHDRPRFL